MGWDSRDRVHTRFPYPVDSLYPAILVAPGPEGSPWFINNVTPGTRDTTVTFLQLNRHAGNRLVQSGEFKLNHGTNDKPLSFRRDRNGAVWVGTSLNGALKFGGGEKTGRMLFSSRPAPRIAPHFTR